MNNINKIILSLIFLVIIFLIVKILGKRKNSIKVPIESFISDEDICGRTPGIVDVNYNLNGVYKKKDTNYYIRNDDKDDEFDLFIEEVQPFHNSLTNDNDYDEIGEVKQSNNYIWVMNRARTRLVKASRNDLQKKNYGDVLTNTFINPGNRLITAWGVSKDELLFNQYCCVYVRDFDVIKDSYFVIFRADTSEPINFYVDINTVSNTDSIIYIQDDNKTFVFGDIDFKQDNLVNSMVDIQHNYYGFYYTKSTESGETSLHKGNYDFNLKTGLMIENNLSITPSSPYNEPIPPTYMNKLGKGPDLTKEPRELIREILLNINNYKEIYPKKDYYTKLFDNDTEDTYNKYLKKYIKYDVEDFKTKDYIFWSRNKNKFYQYLAKFLEKISQNTYYQGICDFRVDYSNGKIYYVTSETDGTDPTKVKLILHNSNFDFKIINESIVINKIVKKVTIKSLDVVERLNIKINKMYQKVYANYLLTVKLAEKLGLKNLVSFEFKNDIVDFNLHYLRTFYDLPKRDDTGKSLKEKSRQQLNKFYQGLIPNNEHPIDIGQNVVGILDLSDEYKNEKSPKIRNLVKQPRRVIYTLFQEIVNKSDKDNIYFSRYNTANITTISSECIPAQKFTYNATELEKELIETFKKYPSNKYIPKDIGKINGMSLYQFFKKNMQKPGENYDPSKFINLGDWVHIYDTLRGEGLYNIKDQDPQYIIISNSFNNNPFFTVENPGKWAGKHKRLLKKNVENIFELQVLKHFPNILVFNLQGEKLSVVPGKPQPDTNVYLHLQFNTKGDNAIFKEDMEVGKFADEDFNFLKLEFDLTRGDNISPSYTEFIDSKEYDFYKLMIEPKNKVIRHSRRAQNKFVWIKREITNFEDFKNLIFDEHSNEEDSRDRLRGIYDIPDMYVDDHYIKYLQTQRVALDSESYSTILEEKKKIRDQYVMEIDGERKNLVGYPFIVFFKYIDYNGYPCEETHRNKQRIFLTNRVLIPNLLKSTDSTLFSPLSDTDYNYPLIKQEFISFSGQGSIIQYHEKKFGGITNINPKKISCAIDSTFMDACSKNLDSNCQNSVLSFTSISGMPKCEIDDAEVVRKNSSPVEVLVPMAVPVNACNVYILKGNMKIYYSLGKIFSYGKNKYQIKGIYTVKNLEDKYLYVKEGEVLESDASLVVDGIGEVKDSYKFYANLKTDKYGTYYILAPFTQKTKVLTSKLHLFQHTLGGKKIEDAKPYLKWTLEAEEVIEKRNHTNDERYYSQKFNMGDALLYNTLGESEDIKNQKLIEKMRKKRIEDSLAAKFFPELAVGDKDYMEPMTTDEEQQALERLLNDINAYLKNITRINPVELNEIKPMEGVLKKVNTMMKSRVPLIRESMNNIKYMAKAQLKNDLPSIYSKFSYPKGDLELETENNISNNDNSVQKVMNEQNVLEMGNALQALKSFVPNEDREQKTCPTLYEGFGNMYDDKGMNNHIVDKYNTFVTRKVGASEDKMENIKDSLFQKMKLVSGKINALKMDGSLEQVKMTQEIEKGMNVKDSIYQIKDHTQGKRLDRIERKLGEVDKLRCQLGDVKYKTKVKDHPNYNSLISREDGNLLNVYKINQCDKLGKTDLEKNMIFVNGGCLSYDEESMKMNVEHCMINEEKQHFNLTKVKEENDLRALNIRNTLKEGELLENPHYVIMKKKNIVRPSVSEAPEDSKYSSDVCDTNYAKFNEYSSDVNENSCQKHENTNLCLHMEEGEISMRNCNHINKQKWDYSDISGSCQ